MLRYDKRLKKYSRKLRCSMTETETALWAKLRRKQILGFQFNRQKPIGKFIVDFYCQSANLVIELDGGQHYTEEGKVSDGLRDEQLRKMGLYVMRFSNRDVLTNIASVIATIYQYLGNERIETGSKSP